jgi:hypothetical protein
MAAPAAAQPLQRWPSSAPDGGLDWAAPALGPWGDGAALAPLELLMTAPRGSSAPPPQLPDAGAADWLSDALPWEHLARARLCVPLHARRWR